MGNTQLYRDVRQRTRDAAADGGDPRVAAVPSPQAMGRALPRRFDAMQAAVEQLRYDTCLRCVAAALGSGGGKHAKRSVLCDDPGTIKATEMREYLGARGWDVSMKSDKLQVDSDHRVAYLAVTVCARTPAEQAVYVAEKEAAAQAAQAADARPVPPDWGLG